MTRLIDADELNRVNEESIAEYSEYYTGDMIHGMRIVCQYAVENAPTVEAIPIEWIEQKMKELDTDIYEYEWLIAEWRIENYGKTD